MTTPASTVPTVRQIVDATAEHFGVTRRDLISQRRSRDVVLPRQIAMYVAKTLTPRSLPEIGRHVGGRDHTTVLHALRKIDELMRVDPAIRTAVDDIVATFAGPIRPVERREADPLVVAIDVATGARRPADIAVDEIEAMAAALVGYARRLGAVTVDGEDEPDPELLPISVVSHDEALIAAVDAARRAWGGYAVARFGPRERGAVEHLQTSLVALFEARSKGA